MARFIAFYLPQYYPIPENDKWYGKGFTEWTNVAKAKPLFKGHYQPHVPADLGFYDMRLPETLLSQVKLANDYGVDGFCYWHYWFGNGRKLLAEPFDRLLQEKDINIEFCLSWANGSWIANKWSDSAGKQIVMEQLYPGKNDMIEHFYDVLPAFKDKRYIKVNGSPLFAIHEPLQVPDIEWMIKKWNELAEKEGIPSIYFVAKDRYCTNKKALKELGFNSIYDMNILRVHNNQDFFTKARLKIQRRLFHLPTVYKYKDAANKMLIDEDKEDDVIPVIAPNWDHSPRSGSRQVMFHDCKPQVFQDLVERTIEINSKKPEEKNIIIIQSWNEWGEGNHLEPDLKYGLGYLEAIKRAREKYKK